MNGLELAEQYYEEYGRPLIAEHFPAHQGRIAAGLVGEGSECLGFDDELSREQLQSLHALPSIISAHTINLSE